ncbi:MAG TPA: DUF3843 family protein [Edaphocola sp.]|nr:DUF3843 family protein [Edaphocola sp.]
MKKQIYIKEWLDVKPYQIHDEVDIYYLNIANRVKEALGSSKIEKYFIKEFKNGLLVNKLACFITCYFEDLISGTQFWQTFLKKYRSQYQKDFPLIKIENYIEDEINIEDIQFLSWYFINCQFLSQFDQIGMESDHPTLKNIAIEVMKIFESEWETAPENTRLLDNFKIDPNNSDYHSLQNILNEFVENNYLLKIDFDTVFAPKLHQMKIAGVTDSEFVPIFSLLYNETKFGMRTRLLGLSIAEWILAYIDADSELGKAIQNFESDNIFDFFIYQGVDLKGIHTFKTVITGNDYEVDFQDDLFEYGKIYLLDLIKWKEQWKLIGLPSLADDPSKYLNNRKNNTPKENALKIEATEILAQCFLEYNKNSPIAFVDGKDSKNFLAEVYQLFNKRWKALKGEQAKGSLNVDNLNNIEEDTPNIIFMNTAYGIEVLWGINDAFPDKKNPFFEGESTEEDINFMIQNSSISKELVEYCLKNYKEKINFNNTFEKDRTLENIDFLMRFCKGEHYFSKIEMTLN